MNKHWGTIAFGAGLAAVAWVAYGYLGANPLALTMSLLIAAFYLMGGLELRHFRQTTAGLQSALTAVLARPEPPTRLDDWLATLPAGLQNPVRQRIEGERMALPGPAMTPYLVGLLVLLGMLGTFLGMVVTLNGTVMALQSSTDLPAMRTALAAPVKGLGLAFGTSVAGVAASAMLGLVSALARRERLTAAQRLEALIAGRLRPFSRAHQREAMLAGLQAQSQLLPELVHSLQAMAGQLAQQHAGLQQQLISGQDHFHQQAQIRYSELADAVDRTLQRSLSEGARAAGAALQPAVEATMAGISRETALFQTRLADAAQQQLDGLATRLDGAVSAVASTWTTALARQAHDQQALAGTLQQTLTRLSTGFEQGTASLLQAVDQRQAGTQRDLQVAAETQAQSAEKQSHALLSRLAQAQATQQAASAASEQQRLVAWTSSLQNLASALRADWQQAGEQALAQQQQICRTLEQTAAGLQAQAAAQSSATLAEMSQLITTASEAPRAAAELVGQLRQQLSASLVHDTGLLEERSRLMATLGHLLSTVNLAATEQRGAIDALVASSAAMLQQAGSQFHDRLEAESARLADAATQLGGSAVEVASLGEAFGGAVQLFGQSSEALVDQLQRIEAALGKSSARSDQQLAYYVAQAREIVDLSISSQRQIVEDLQQLAIRQQPLAGAAA